MYSKESVSINKSALSEGKCKLPALILRVTMAKYIPLVNPAEEAAIWHAEKEQAIENLKDNLDRALNRLFRIEQSIIQKRYLEDEDVFDYMIYDELEMNARTYGFVKARAFFLLC
jgi:ArpU family phage transcriptional regulator